MPFTAAALKIVKGDLPSQTWFRRFFARHHLNRDETPQFVDYASNKGNQKTKVAAGVNDPAIRIDAENRQCESVDMTWGADGFQYGLHHAAEPDEA